MSRAKFAFSAHPDAIADLRQLPEPIRDQALLHLQDLVHGERVATRLEGRLEGCHKIVLGAGGEWASHRLVVQFRDAPAASQHRREVHLIAAGPRLDYAVYRSAQNRLGRTGLNLPPGLDPAREAQIRQQQETRVRAARARSVRPAPGTAGAPAYTTASPGFATGATTRKAR
ncbi:hypothetical protein ACFY2K_40035 [Kitasatospora sp. NPDC001309]|uniref:hypothetical protein n=1 Tax=Kitasatospora sp. NPDC001309 TaxID=3364013 RepID=UPI0036B017D9